MSFTTLANKKTYETLLHRLEKQDKYTHQLEEVLQSHGIELPLPLEPWTSSGHQGDVKPNAVLQVGSIEEIEHLIDETRKVSRDSNVAIEYHNLRVTRRLNAKNEIISISSIVESLFTFWQRPEKKDVEILADISGRILPSKMTLLMGPPGSGKSVLLRALSGRLHPIGDAQ